MLTIKQFNEFCEGILQAANAASGKPSPVAKVVFSEIGPML
jgi:hypothetical protein